MIGFGKYNKIWLGRKLKTEAGLFWGIFCNLEITNNRKTKNKTGKKSEKLIIKVCAIRNEKCSTCDSLQTKSTC